MTLEPESSRAKRSVSEISAHTDKLDVVKAIRGDDLYPDKWWRAGNGAWGCLQTHIRIAQDAWMDGVKNYLVFEDDVVLDPKFGKLLPEFLEELPENWDQVYLGGQHRRSPRWVSPRVYELTKINRTHCFGLKRETIPEFLCHVTEFKDHIESDIIKHIDHRLEDAHMSRRWITYGPSWWLVGQGENWSGVNGRWHPDKWWDHNLNGAAYSLPFIWVDRPPIEEEEKLIHFGWAERNPEHKHLDPFFLKPSGNPRKGLKTIGLEAWDCRRLAGAAFYEDESLDPDKFLSTWEGPVVKLSDLSLDQLRKMVDYPNNGAFKHRWVNP